jgi:hypothetical protein
MGGVYGRSVWEECMGGDGSVWEECMGGVYGSVYDIAYQRRSHQASVCSHLGRFEEALERFEEDADGDEDEQYRVDEA